MTFALLIALISLAAWLYLLTAHGGFWRGHERESDETPPAGPAGGWPSVAAIVPARNEADVVAASLGSLLRQDYEGAFEVILIDDQSSDGTAEIARAAADAAGGRERLTVLAGNELPPGWTGKLWAISQGVARRTKHAQSPRRARPPQACQRSQAYARAKATLIMGPMSQSKAAASVQPRVSHSRTVASLRAKARNRPSGEKATSL